MPVELIQIPINGANREDIDPKLMPTGLFKSVINGRLRKTGELGVRYGFTALGSAVFGGGTLKAFDVVTHNDTLLAFGTENASAGGPEKVFTFSEETSEWIPEQTGTRPRAFCAISELEEVFRPPFVKTDEAQQYDVAYANGHVALVFNGHADEGNLYVHIFDPVTGSAVFSTEVVSRSQPRVVGVGAVFVFAWRDASSVVYGATFEVGTDTALSSETALHSAGTVGDGIDLAPVAGTSDEFLLAVVRSDTGVCTIRRCSDAIAVLATGTLTDTDVSLASIAGADGGSTTVVYVRTGGTYRAESFDTAALGSAVAPVSIFGGASGSRPPGIVRKNSTQVVITASIPDTIDSQLRSELRTESTLALVGSSLTFREVSSQSKPFVSPDGQFVGVVSPHGQGGLTSFTGIFDVEFGRGYECAHNRGFAVDALPTWLGSVATDGTSFWCVFPVTDLNCSNMPVVMQFRAMSPERRQTATLGGLLYVAGGFVGVWDGSRTVEAGYFDTPILASATPSVGAGALESDSLYVYAVAFDWYDKEGNRHLSPVSDDLSMVTGAGENTATLVVSTPKTIRVAQGSDQAGKVIVYRTRKAPDLLKRRTVFAYPVAGSFAATVTVVDLSSDDEITTQEVIYTQGARGTLSGPLQHEAPFPAQFLCAGKDRIGSAGLPNQSEWQRSKRFFPEEPIEWSGTPGFRGRVTGRTTGVWSQDDTDYVTTRDHVFVVGGVGPDDQGNGDFDSPRELPGDSVGCIDSRASLLTAQGTWFQAFPDRMYLLPRGGGAAQWVSQPVRDTLAAFPRIVGSAVCSLDNTAVWACNDTGGTDRRLVALDIRTGDWYIDELVELPSGPIQALCEHKGRLQLVIGGLVYQQDNTYPASAFIPVTIETGRINAAGPEGWFRTRGFVTTGKMLANHRIEVDVTYDDGKNYIPCRPAPVDIQTSRYAEGDTVSLRWFPRRRKGEGPRARIRITELSGASQGQTLTNLQVEVIRNKKARRAVKQQG